MHTNTDFYDDDDDGDVILGVLSVTPERAVNAKQFMMIVMIM